ncbi:unnamed protein product, partial [Heterosigma akashiwo]
MKGFACLVVLAILCAAEAFTSSNGAFSSPFRGSNAKDIRLQSTISPKVFKTSQMMAADEAGEIPAKASAEEVTLEEEAPVELTEQQRKEAEKQAEIQRLRDAEKFITKMTGEFQCSQCNYVYKPDEGERNILPGTSFADLPTGYQCPECGAPKSFFDALTVTIAGFEDNQGYGFGTNSMTGDQKNTLIFGGLA